MTTTPSPEQPTRRVIRAARGFDGRGVMLDDAAVLVAGQRIEAFGRAAAIIQRAGAGVSVEDFPGCTLLPGLIDAHTHLIMTGTGQPIMDHAQLPDELMLLIAARNAERSLRSGVTTVVDLGAKGSLTFRLRDAIEQGIVTGSRLLLCGRALTITGGHAWPWLGEADGKDGGRRAVRTLCKEGADLIKVMVTGGGTPGTDGRRPAYTPAELAAIVDEAHARGRRVVGHCTAVEGIERALDAGVDVIAHCQFLTAEGGIAFDERLARRMVDQGVFVNPTLQVNRVLLSDRVPRATMPEAERARLDAWCARYLAFVDGFNRLRAAGVRMVCGSDSGWGYVRFDETHLEVEAMVEAGMSPADALLAATGTAADALGWGDRIGSLAPARFADLLVVAGDPTRDVRTLGKVHAVWLAGQRIAPLACHA